jgi:hypothetical protein
MENVIDRTLKDYKRVSAGMVATTGTIIFLHKLHHCHDILVGASSIGETTPPSPQLTLLEPPIDNLD